MRQNAAQVLGVTIADTDIISADTYETPFDAGAYASGTIFISGQAVKLADEKLAFQLLSFAAAHLQTTPQALTIANGTFQLD